VRSYEYYLCEFYLKGVKDVLKLSVYFKIDTFEILVKSTMYINYFNNEYLGETSK